MKLGKILGIDIILNWTVLFLALMIFNSFNGMFAVKLSVLGKAASISATLLTVVGLIASVLAHELGHAFVGQKFGLTFHSITLHIFGGAARMSNKMPSAKGEFYTAIAGPIVSILLGLSFGFLCMMALLLDKIVPSIALYLFYLLSLLASINVSLGVFNLLPFVFPMDGARVLRAAIWGITKNYNIATKIVGRIGQCGALSFVGIGILMCSGVNVPFFGTGVMAGLWISTVGLLLLVMATNEIKSTV